MAHPGTTLKALLDAPQPNPEEIARYLDLLSPSDRIAAGRSLSGRRLQRALWHAVASNPAIHTDDLVPPDYEREKAVPFHGKNSLPAFTEFEKICFRPRDERAGNVLWGYNETRIRPVVGPGYYVVHDTGPSPLGEVAFDYTQVPPHGLAGWPAVVPNSAGLSRFVYNGMLDYMRRVARDVFIGSAARGGREIDSYFVLVREL